MKTFFLQVLLLAMFATTALAIGPSIKHKFLCDWDVIIEEANTDKCKPYAAHSPDKPQQSLDKPQQSLDKPQQSPDKPQQSLDKPQQSPDKPQQSLDKPQQSLDKPQQSPDKPQQSLDKPQQSPDKPQQSLDKPQQTLQAIMVVPSKPSEGTELASRTVCSECSEQCACFFKCSMIIVGILTFFALLALIIATYVAGCQMMMAVK
uniref:Uncharacterized protein n=1 Tax=Globodera rostochiensis TaxID=31243 RepID=A0A914IED4_GLORO